jgi:glycosyltransferase involved in cell wall biosynthesis
MKISVKINVFNEEENIGPVCESVAWADEIVIVDSNSTDRTLEIARKYT